MPTSDPTLSDIDQAIEILSRLRYRLRPKPRERSAVERWLEDLLAPGPRDAASVLGWGQQDHGFSVRAIRTAKARLGVRSVRHSQNGHGGGYWQWVLPPGGDGVPYDP